MCYTIIWLKAENVHFCVAVPKHCRYDEQINAVCISFVLLKPLYLVVMKHRRSRRGHHSSMMLTVGSTVYTSVLDCVLFVYARSFDIQLLEDDRQCILRLFNGFHRRRNL